MEEYLNVGCGPFRTDLPNWINTDVVHIPGYTEPDIVVTPDDPLPFKEEQFTRIYMGHVLEHVPVGAGFTDVNILDITNQSSFKGWPVVSFSEDQMALIARRPK